MGCPAAHTWEQPTVCKGTCCVADTSPLAPTDRWMRARPSSKCLAGHWVLKLHLPGSQPPCPTDTGSQGTQLHPAGGPIAARPPTSLHPCFSPPPSSLRPGAQQACSPPSFHVFASVSPSSSGKSLRNPPPKHVFFPVPTLPSSLHTYLLHTCVARLISSMFLMRCKSKAWSHPFPRGCTAPPASPQTHPRLTAPLLSCCRGKPLPMVEHHPSAHGPSTSRGARQIRLLQPSSSRAGGRASQGVVVGICWTTHGSTSGRQQRATARPSHAAP